MSTVIQVKRSSVQGKVPTTTDLSLGEFAINSYDGKLYIKKNVNGTESIVDVTAGTNLTLTSNSSSVSVNSDTGTDVTVLAANSTIAGVLTADAQTIGGAKTFNSNVRINGITTLGPTGGEGGELQILNPDGSGSWYFDIPVTNVARIYSLANSASFQIGQTGGTGGDIRLYTEATEKVRLVANGNLGIGTTTPAAKLEISGGDVRLNSAVNLSAEAITLATVTKTQVSSFAVASFRSAKLVVQAYNSVTGEVQITELLVAHNGTTASATEYGVVFTGSVSFVTYDVDILSGNVRLMVTNATANSTQYKVSETLMVA